MFVQYTRQEMRQITNGCWARFMAGQRARRKKIVWSTHVAITPIYDGVRNYGHKNKYSANHMRSQGVQWVHLQPQGGSKYFRRNLQENV